MSASLAGRSTIFASWPLPSARLGVIAASPTLRCDWCCWNYCSDEGAKDAKDATSELFLFTAANRGQQATRNPFHNI